MVIQAKKVLSLFTSPHFKSANAVYNILGLDETNKIIAMVFGQEVEELKDSGEKPSEESVQEDSGK